MLERCTSLSNSLKKMVGCEGGGGIGGRVSTIQFLHNPTLRPFLPTKRANTKKNRVGTHGNMRLFVVVSRVVVHGAINRHTRTVIGYCMNIFDLLSMRLSEV